jgi:hypothetical protein
MPDCRGRRLTKRKPVFFLLGHSIIKAHFIVVFVGVLKESEINDRVRRILHAIMFFH